MALRDNGKWHAHGSSGEVVGNAQSLGFPANMPKALRVSWTTATAMWRESRRRRSASTRGCSTSR
jgi:hypothetical protein